MVVSTGLRNLGNTCYLNAQLQCAFHIPLIRDLVLSGGEAPVPLDDSDKEHSPFDSLTHEDEAEDATSTTLERKVPISPGLLALKQVFREMLDASNTQSGPVSPRNLALSLGIPVWQQQDSQEFWKLFLPALQLPALANLYQGSFEDYISALDGSQRERRRQEEFLDLSLDVQGTNPSVSSSLKQLFGEPELLSVAEGNGWRPEKGADKVNAHKGSLLRPQGLPSILQLHLKRFNYDWNRDVMEKLNGPLSFSSLLDLSGIAANDDDEEPATDERKKDTLLYDLQAVVVHAGEFGSGHYYAYVRPSMNERDTWYRFNDDSVTKVSFEDVLTDATGGKVKLGSSDSTINNTRGFWSRIRASFRPRPSSSFGFGGQTSNAYVLQYVQRSAIPTLYAGDSTHV